MLATGFRSAVVRYGADPVALDVRCFLRSTAPAPEHPVPSAVTTPHLPLHVRLALRDAAYAALATGSATHPRPDREYASVYP